MDHRTSQRIELDHRRGYFAEPIGASTDYALRVVIRNDSQVTLYVGGTAKISHTFGGPLI